MIRPLIVALLTLALLAGCATRPLDTEAPHERVPWRDQAQRLERLEHWTLAGKVGLRTPQDSTSANLDWTQYPGYYRMLISGPFGSGRNLLEGRQGRVSLSTSEGRFEADSPEALMEQQLGWSLPISALDHWVRGLPAPGSHYEREADELGYPKQLQQAGWEIDYRDWRQADGLWLPQRMVMTYDELRATLVINDWQPGEPR
ncbi:outer-membrane lipoprotein LolB [Litchfieldella qijiaojingensis]|uniref:Outer-membrane lipoprotein LolB n=1 Tax=Litchfieldella qijiaojingensis TaxID=980347 RepID=A0ABQ2YFT5_9GAMM|nr:lipoprotein insertase outer membrane protein LolB [Halomonas qijiaojingensis]GGX82206.1 outer-membrane lipoprotein LolB [Halomonas qijiaojingensis]